MNSSKLKPIQIERRPATTRKWKKLRRAAGGRKNSTLDVGRRARLKKIKTISKSNRSIVGESIDEPNECTCGLIYFDRLCIHRPQLLCYIPYPILNCCCSSSPIDWWCRCHPILRQKSRPEVSTKFDSKLSNSQHVRQMDCEIKNSAFKDALLSTAIVNNMGPNFDHEVQEQRQLCQHRDEKQQICGKQDGCQSIRRSPTKLVEILRSGSYSLSEANNAFNQAVQSKLASGKIALSVNARDIDISVKKKSTPSPTPNLSKSIDAAFEGSLHRKRNLPPKVINRNFSSVALSQLAPDNDNNEASLKQTYFKELIKVNVEDATPTKQWNHTEIDSDKVPSELAASSSNVEAPAARKECTRSGDIKSNDKILSELAATSSNVDDLNGKHKNFSKNSINTMMRKEAKKQFDRTDIDNEKILSQLAAASSNTDTRFDAAAADKENIRREDAECYANDKILSELAAASSSFSESGVKRKSRLKAPSNIFVKLRETCHK